MKLTVQRKYICFLLMVILVVSGMCFDTVKADAYFLFEKAANESSMSYINKSATVKQHAYVEEQTEKNEICSVSERIGGRRETRARNANGNASLQSALLSESQLQSYHEAARFILPKNTMSAAIISYVHHQDGSKE